MNLRENGGDLAGALADSEAIAAIGWLHRGRRVPGARPLENEVGGAGPPGRGHAEHPAGGSLGASGTASGQDPGYRWRQAGM